MSPQIGSGSDVDCKRRAVSGVLMCSKSRVLVLKSVGVPGRWLDGC